MRKPYNNEKTYDPGRFRTTIEVHKVTSVPDGSGGSDPEAITIRSFKALEQSVFDDGELESSTGATVVNEDKYFIVRHAKDFTFTKGMLIFRDGYYTLAAIKPEGNPVKYQKLLCIRKNGED